MLQSLSLPNFTEALVVHTLITRDEYSWIYKVPSKINTHLGIFSQVLEEREM
jgi:hypothetical protein